MDSVFIQTNDILVVAELRRFNKYIKKNKCTHVQGAVMFDNETRVYSQFVQSLRDQRLALLSGVMGMMWRRGGGVWISSLITLYS